MTTIELQGSRYRSSARGFARAEALVAMLVTMAVVALVMITTGESRRQARLGEDIAKLRGFGAATASYGADHQDLLWSFSWQGGVTYKTPYPDLNFAADDMRAQANQAIYILRTHGGVPEAQPINGWIANIQYSHFVLAEYQDRPLPDFEAISSMDKLRLQWAQNPNGTGQGPHGLYPCSLDPIHCKTLPRSASFRLVVAAYDGSPVGSRISPASVPNTYYVFPGTELGGRPLSEVAFPAQKVLMADSYARHFGPEAIGITDGARLPLLFVDGSVNVRAASDSNPGWQPNSPASPVPTTVGSLVGRFLWTRGGLAGRDFGGPEVCTGQPACP